MVMSAEEYMLHDQQTDTDSHVWWIPTVLYEIKAMLVVPAKPTKANLSH